MGKLVGKPSPASITFGELGEKSLANYPFNKISTEELHEQVVRTLLMPRWADEVAIEIDPPKLKAWLVGLDVESSTRGKYKSIMSGVYNWGQCEGLIPRGEQFNPCRHGKGREFSQVTGYEALALEIEDTLKVLSELKQPEYELALLVATCGLRISEALGLKCGFRFTPETGQCLWVFGYFVWQKLEGNKPAELHILSLVDDAHPAAAQLFDDAVVAQFKTDA